jgi:hypothetical protein
VNIYPNNDMIVTLTGLKGSDNAAISDATLTATLTDHGGNAVSGVDPITLTPGAGGTYTGTLPAANLTPSRQYQLKIVGSGSGTGLSLTLTLFAVVRTS